MKLPAHKSKIIRTIGPASEQPEIMAKMLRAGMNPWFMNLRTTCKPSGDFISAIKRP